MPNETDNHSFYIPDENQDGWGDNKGSDWADLDLLLKHIENDGSAIGTEADPLPEQHVESSHAQELSVTGDSGGITETIVDTHEDTDTTTSFSMDLSQLPEHDDFEVVGKMNGHDTNTDYKPIHIQVNGHTSYYRYEFSNRGTISYTNGDTAWKETTFSGRSFRPHWILTGTATGTDSRSLSIRSRSMMEYQGETILTGTIAQPHPLTRINIFTDWNCVGKLIVKGIDY